MKREILLIAAALWATSAAATEAGHCDSKPFTLKKPTTTPATAAAPAATPAPAPAPKPATKPTPSKTAQADKPKSKYLIGCKQPKS